MIVHFAVDLHRELLHSRQEKLDTVISSPFSIAAVLSMTLAGARGKTAEELLSVLRVKDDKVHENFAAFLPKLSSHSHKLQFHLANRIYSDQKFPVVENYVAFLNSSYVSTILSVEFEKSESVRAEINDWVKVTTESKIVDMLGPGIVTASTGVILVSAIYFRGLWELPFPTSSTSRHEFNVNSKTKVEVDMMHQKQEFAIARSDELKARAIEMPYKGGKASMVILLPDDIDGLSHLEHHLSHCKLSTILADLKETPNVQVSLPKLSFQQGLSLKSTLTAMGLNDLFSTSCDLSGMFKTGRPSVFELVHRVFLQIDEGGTEPGPATAGEASAPAGPEAAQTTEFLVDHPFMLLVLKSKSDVVLFIGSVRRP
ncbi:hypothetical protein V5799_031165 [Amblyomma americanum]|uniref:Serpin domain-containing protein n=1 Tax=Amblyomma americanum TaxID=6943 RepID=A0AAQ4ELC2_AMBAM